MSQDVDTYSLPAPGERLWDRLRFVREREDRPTVGTDWTELWLPRIRPITEVEDAPRGRGQPRRDLVKARDVALAWDIEGFRPRPERAFTNGSGVSGLDRVLGVPATAWAIAYELDSWKSKTVYRWRDDGRRSWTRLGAWPWAVVPDGKLPRDWWTRREYAEALAAWEHSGGCLEHGG